MALEAAIFQQDYLGSYNRDLYNMLDSSTCWNSYDFGLQNDVLVDDSTAGGGGCSSSLDFLVNQTETFHHHHLGENIDYWNINNPYSSPTININNDDNDAPSPVVQTVDGSSGVGISPPSSEVVSTRPKRRRAKSRKNKEDIENQRMTHIAVERNRRKQMNEYLSVLRSLMPDSYVQRGDQASIIGGAINFVKELEHKLQLLGGHKEMNQNSDMNNNGGSPFAEFFTFPQYSFSSLSSSSTTASSTITENYSTSSNSTTESGVFSSSSSLSESTTSNTQNAIADIEVTMVETHANLKIRSKRRPKQLLKVVSGLQNMRLNILHLNVTSIDHFVLYSLCVKVEDDCKLTSVDDIATAVYQLLWRIQEEMTP